MPGVLTSRLPGVSFDVVTPPPPAVLPRMDIAGFVGFAASGPVGVPVPVEDVGRFRDVFGGEVDLAWDAERDRMATGHLGAAVEAFFRHGGRRCWVVRVAGPEAATHTFEVPGLWAVPNASGALDWDARSPAEAAARSPGRWADALRLGAVLRAPGLRPVEIRHLADGSVAVEVVRPARGTVEVGDLVRVVLAEAGEVLFLFAASVTPEGPASLCVRGTEAVWFAAPSSPPDLGVDALLGLGPADLHRTRVTPPATDVVVWPTSPPSGASPVVSVLRMDLLAWEGQEETARLRDLTFHPSHPRFWGALPSDAALFALDADRSAPPLAADADDPRAPFAGTGDLRPTIPLGMAVRSDPEAAAPPTSDASLKTALARDGLGTFSSALFLDPALQDALSHTLAGRVTQRRVVDGAPLLGVHALFPLDEVTLVAVPDAVHRAWGARPDELPNVLPAPRLGAVSAPDARGVYTMAWTEVSVPEPPAEAVEGYKLQESASPDFAEAVVRYAGADTDAGFEEPDGPSRTLYYRVRAVEGGRVSAWSNTASTVVPPRPFEACERAPEAPRLDVLNASPADAGRTLSWTLPEADAPPPPDVAFIVERAPDPGFLAARTFLAASVEDFNGDEGGLDRDGPAFLAPVAPPASGVLYLRVRAARGGLLSPWSNTVLVSAEAVETTALVDPQAYDPSALLDVHRALLRLGAARGDVFAVLAVPDHFERTHALAHKGRLTPQTDDDTEAALVGPVPALTYDEERALSFGALYYPWLAVRGPEAADVRPVPPDGAVVGTFAEVALREGAWIAPANRPLRDVIAVEPRDDRAGWGALFGAQVNAVRPDPRGTRLLSADTLHPDESLRPIQVRRLLSLLRRLALREGAVYAFEPNGAALQRRVFYQFDTLLADLYRRGAFAGRTPEQAFQVITGASVNPPSGVDRGRLVVELRVAPARALEFLVVRLFQQDAGGIAVATA